MVSEEECHRTIERGDYYVICPMLPELLDAPIARPARITEYSSSEITLDRRGLQALLEPFLSTRQPGVQA
jgi:UDP-glucose 4-epimerase